MTGHCEECGSVGPVNEDGVCADCAAVEARRVELAGIVAQAREAADYARRHRTHGRAR